jgi:hypothetical protein
MCCLVTIILMLGPRLGAILWWLFDMDRWAATFPNIIVPIVGIILLPWTTLAYVLVFPGGVTGLDWLWIIIGLLIDLGSFSGSGWKHRSRFGR